MTDSIVKDENGNSYPDLATFDINRFIVNSRPIERKLSYNDCLRYFDVSNAFYGEYDFYDDISLWLNDILYITDTDTNFEKITKFYTKQDIDAWFIKELP